MDARKRVGPEDDFNANSGVKKSKQELESSPSTGMGNKSKPFMNFFRTALTQMVGPNQASIYVASPPPIPDGPSQPAVETCLCNKYNTSEGCLFGDKCHFDPYAMASGHFAGEMTHLSPPLSFGGPLTAKISVDASLARAVICEENKIRRKTGVTLFIREHVSNPNLRNIELEGKFDQVKRAIDVVTVLIGKTIPGAPASQPSIYK